MKMMIQIAVVALLCGGVSAAGSIYWHQQQLKAAAALAAAQATEEKAAEGEKEATDNTANQTGSDTAAAATPDELAISTKSELEAEPVSFGPPVAVRPPFDANGDEAGDLINTLRIRASTASRHEINVLQREEAMKLILEDLRLEQASSAKMKKRILDETNQTLKTVDEARRETETDRALLQEEQIESRRVVDAQLESMRQEKDDAAQVAENALNALRKEREELQKQLDAIRAPKEPRDQSGSPAETVNLKKMVGVVDSMPPEDTAKILQGLVEKGKTEAVVAVLNAMKPRQSAKVLSAITEAQPGLAADLVDRLKRLKKETEAPPEPKK